MSATDGDDGYDDDEDMCDDDVKMILAMTEAWPDGVDDDGDEEHGYDNDRGLARRGWSVLLCSSYFDLMLCNGGRM